MIIDQRTPLFSQTNLPRFFVDKCEESLITVKTNKGKKGNRKSRDTVLSTCILRVMNLSTPYFKVGIVTRAQF